MDKGKDGEGTTVNSRSRTGQANEGEKRGARTEVRQSERDSYKKGRIMPGSAAAAGRLRVRRERKFFREKEVVGMMHQIGDLRLHTSCICT